MKLAATVAYDNSDLIYASFYDHEKIYGFSLTRHEDDKTIEVMVADQSCYGSDNLTFKIRHGHVQASFPTGTIDSIDGEDFYEIEFDIPSNEYHELVKILKEIFMFQDGLHVTDLAQDGTR